MRHLRAIILGTILLCLIVVALWQARTFFLQNKVTFLLNQKQYDEAAELVDRLSDENPDNHRTQFLRVKVLTLTGNYKQAAAFQVNQDVAEDSPEVLYWSSLSHWQLGHDDLARQIATDFIASGESLPDQPSMLLARNLAGRNEPLPAPDRISRGFRLLFPLEQAIYLGLAAEQEMELGRVNIAADLFERAFTLGNRNRETLLLGTEAASLSGNGQLASMLLAFSGIPSIEPLYEKLLSDYEQYKTASRTIHDQELTGRGGRLDLAHALSWAGTVYLAEDVTTHMYPVLRVMADLQQEYPYDRMLTSRMAVVLEILKRFDEAYALYEELYDEAPNLVTGLRMWTLEAVPEAEISRRIGDFMSNLEVVDQLTTSSFSGEQFHRDKHFLAFYNDASAKATFNLPENGSYMITMIARGDKAFNRWPLVKITVDGEFVDYRYIRRDAWDCYSLNLVLDAGSHNIEVEYLNDREGIRDDSEARSFYLRSIYVTNPGVV